MSVRPLYGKVVLAGAGPGDPELVTVKALRYLQQADVVITDKLVSEDLLQQAKEGASIIRVGKEPGNSNSTPQSVINEMLVDYARSNNLVVRLKGGDVSLFSNVLDELQVLSENRIPYEIVPGITAASGASAYAGIPLTARGFSNGARFLTCYDAAQQDGLDWKDLASTDDTLVFYMSMRLLDSWLERFLFHSPSSVKQIAIIEQATTPSQRVHVFGLMEAAKHIPNLHFDSPGLVIIGHTVALHHEFKWFESQTASLYFRPVDRYRENYVSALPC
jgi:uroporphyrin-III C-methyltransferase